MSPIGAIIMIVLLIAFSLAAIYLLYQVMLNFQPGRNKLKKDMQQMRKLTEPETSSLIPLDYDEMELLSFNQINQSKKTGMVRTHKGTFTTIYHEPVITYAYKRYMSGKENALLLARTADHEFTYRIKGGEVSILMDGQELGILKQDSSMYGGRKKKLLAHIDREKHDTLMPVKIRGKEVGMLAKPEKARATNPRAFEILHPMSEEEQLVLKSLVILEAVRKDVN